MGNTPQVTCTLCGFTFAPEDHAACTSCPLHQGCTMACCPNCGASNINTSQSKLAKFITRILGDKHVESEHLPNIARPGTGQ